MLDLSVIILNYNTRELTLQCLGSIFEKKWQVKFDVWVVDNASTDDSVEWIRKKFPEVHLIESDKNLGFAGGNNLALKQAHARYYLLLNSDTEVFEGALDGLVDFMDKGGYGVGSCKLVGVDGKFQPNGGDLPFGLALFVWISGLDDVLFFMRGKLPTFHRQFESYYQGNKDLGWVSGSVMVIKKSVRDQIGLLDESIFMYGEDAEYCFRAKKAGFRIGWTDKILVKHLGGGSSRQPSLRQWVGEFRGLLFIYRKYYGVIAKVLLQLLIYLFILVRMVAFFVVGKPKISKVYGKVLVSL